MIEQDDASPLYDSTHVGNATRYWLKKAEQAIPNVLFLLLELF
jgi:hypothetical protein